MIGSGEGSITVIIQKNDMVHAITDLSADHTIGLSISNFQKKTGALVTFKFSVIELLVDVSEKYLSFLFCLISVSKEFNYLQKKLSF